MTEKHWSGEQWGDCPRRRKTDRHSRRVNWQAAVYWLAIMGFATYGAWESAMRLSGR